jgi:proteic killer suppression protein
MIRSIRNKGLASFAEKGSVAKLSVRKPERIRRILAALDAAVAPEDMNLPGLFFHGLHADPKRYSVRVSGNWRITFAWDEGAIDVDLEDYH